MPEQAGNDHPTSIPTGVFPTADGHINIARRGPGDLAALLRGDRAPELARATRTTRRRPTRSKNRDALNAAIGAITAPRSRARDWIELLNEAGVPCGPIYTIDQVFADPQVRHLGMAQPVRSHELGDIELVGQPIS